MCKENVKQDTRKKVLKLVHETALAKAEGSNRYIGKGLELNRALQRWVDELAEKHKKYPCKICDHTL